MKRLRLLWRILETTQASKIMLGFILFVLASALAFSLLEPDIQSFGGGLWYCFAVFTTIGFGDVIAITTAGRILTVILGLYGILVVALVPGVLVSYFMETSKMKADQSITEFLDKLEHLPELSKEELKALSEAVKQRRNNI